MRTKPGMHSTRWGVMRRACVHGSLSGALKSPGCGGFLSQRAHTSVDAEPGIRRLREVRRAIEPVGS